MQIGQKFNTLNVKEYCFYIDNHKTYQDFNTLGLYRSIVENEKLSLEEKIAVRAHAHQTFQKTFDFLVLKDPKTYMEVTYLGQELTRVKINSIWEEIRQKQEKILQNKKIKHRNFGVYAKHNCGDQDCIWNGLMVRQGSWLVESEMHFDKDQPKYSKSIKAEKRKSDRKRQQQIVRNDLALE